MPVWASAFVVLWESPIYGNFGCILFDLISIFVVACAMGRIMSIDYGKRRSGVAVTDPLQIVAGGLETVATPELPDFIRRYIATENVERIVVGLPVQNNGNNSENAARVRAFAGKMQKELHILVEFYDERFTSVLAHKTMLASGLHKMARRDKALVDKISATIILQSYMESRRGIPHNNYKTTDK